jgi:ribonuclease HI
VAKVYVVTAPDRIRGVYETWAACEAAVKGVPGARYQAVGSRAQAEAMLRGEGTALESGLYAFVDGNHHGGVGVVIVQGGGEDPAVLDEASMTVTQVFAGGAVRALAEPAAIAAALARLRNVLAELAALYLALRLLPERARVTIVHDYEGLGAWMTGRWKTRDATVAEVVAACAELAARRGLTLTFRHQRGHQAAWAGRDDYAQLNARADALATDAARG